MKRIATWIAVVTAGAWMSAGAAGASLSSGQGPGLAGRGEQVAAQSKTKKELEKLERGDKTPGQVYDGRKSVDPVEVQKSTTTRTPEQAIKEYKDSGRANPGPNTLKTKEVPPPKKK